MKTNMDNAEWELPGSMWPRHWISGEPMSPDAAGAAATYQCVRCEKLEAALDALQRQLEETEKLRAGSRMQADLLCAVLSLVPDRARADAWRRLGEFEPAGEDVRPAPNDTRDEDSD